MTKTPCGLKTCDLCEGPIKYLSPADFGVTHDELAQLTCLPFVRYQESITVKLSEAHQDLRSRVEARLREIIASGVPIGKIRVQWKHEHIGEFKFRFDAVIEVLP